MLISAKMRVVIEVDVTDVESITQARESAFELVKPLLSSKRGRKAAGPRAIVTGISVVCSDTEAETDSVNSV